MAIWFQTSSLEKLQERNANTLIDHLDIRFTEIGEDYLCAEMPVDHRTVQPLGLLHGGASVALAETLGSVAANLVVDRQKKVCLGLEINANHLKSAKSGKVTGMARPVHIGSSTQVWSIEIRNEAGQLTCISRITMAVLDVK
ncbi:MAG TPA: hotdog fold thioesterase [Flavisolibacter sp.]|nr:hotdog fold thioesterase [Flavisolibacter sp.]